MLINSLNLKDSKQRFHTSTGWQPRLVSGSQPYCLSKPQKFTSWLNFSVLCRSQHGYHFTFLAPFLNIWCSRMFPADRITFSLKNIGKKKNEKEKLTEKKILKIQWLAELNWVNYILHSTLKYNFHQRDNNVMI